MQRFKRRRTTISSTVLASVALLIAAAGIDQQAALGETSSDVASARHQAAKRTRRIIMNNDGNDCLTVDENLPKNLSERAKEIVSHPVYRGPHTPEALLARRTDPVLGTHVDTIFYSDGVFNSYTHQSDETELRRNVSFHRHAWADELIEKYGKDPLTYVIECCRQNDIEIFWSMRMNDTHDSGPQYAGVISKWKKDHPELLMAPERTNFPYGCGRWSAVDYGQPEVREKVFRIIKDVVTRYDVDGVELDFLRHPVLFKPQMTGDPVTQEHCDMLTGLVKRVRKMTDEVAEKRGKPVLIAVRIPDSVAYSKALGIDIEAWLDQDLVDIIIGGGYFHLEPWENLAALGKKHHVPVYACLSNSRLPLDGANAGPDMLGLWRGEALRAWEAGVDGIYTFNLWHSKNDSLFRELGDPELLRTLPHRYERIDAPGSKYLLKRYLKGGENYVVDDPGGP